MCIAPPSLCTWQDCGAAATHAQVGSDGRQWANLCSPHHEQLRAAIATGDMPDRIAGAWVLAQGGIEAATKNTAAVLPWLYEPLLKEVMRRFVDA
jgi:hypothetical protein